MRPGWPRLASLEQETSTRPLFSFYVSVRSSKWSFWYLFIFITASNSAVWRT